ncbi:MAG: DUF3710 domain-containing protein [Austwickia sp.]|nr:DUF3710 domain-containing protein [Actinomycetota bacterium]MCO5309254.1 DUF3710 domain-containing protein [Austwickia sp.]
MALFRRKRRAGEDTVGRRVVVTDELALEETLDGYDEDDYELDDAVEPGPAPVAAEEPVSTRSQTGPFDRDEVEDSLGERIDLGSLWLGVVGGAQLRIEIDPQTSQIQAVTTDLGSSSMQVQAFAAPRTAGIWPLIRDEIADSVTARGGRVEQVGGDLGTELLTELPSRGPDGRVTTQSMRFIGVDGPRWFLRAVLTGPAATDPTAAAPFYDMIRRSVVVRGDDARPPREMLPLVLPKDLVEGETGEAELVVPSTADLNPFERGPEITEIR